MKLKRAKNPGIWEFKKLMPWQSQVFQNEKQFRLVCGGRRLGKTTLITVEIINEAIKNPGTQIALIYPSLKQAKTVFWNNFVDLAEKQSHFFKKIDKSLLIAHFKNGSRLLVFGLENPSTMRGIKVSLAILDEFQDAPGLTEFYQAALPTITKTEEFFAETELEIEGRMLILGTSAGINHFYDLIKMQAKNPSWKIWILPTNSINAKHISAETLENIRNTMPENDWLREYCCDFSAFKGLIFNYKKNIHCKILNLPVKKAETVIAGIDFGYSPHPLGIICAAKFGNIWVVIDEYKETGKTVNDIIPIFQKWIKEYGLKFIYCSPEENTNIAELNRLLPIAALKARNEVKNGIAHLRLLMHFNQNSFPILNSTKSIQNLNSISENDPLPKLYIAAKNENGESICPELENELLQYSYAENAEEPIKKNDDLCDALRYAIYTFYKKRQGGIRNAEKTARAY